ncbi:neurotrypsin-like [Mercenaria mercenaria]|uniref:neurotrypsin-like n=1 Tax=Mercenaria mercenaria TaxID=6596 RepID=UPI00234ECA84|nr:neurotrypsin-like [Mercenaria mercenaria]
MYDAQTICNTYDASLAMYFDTAVYGEGTGPILISQIACNAEKDNVNSCYLYAPHRPSSSHLYDLSIACTPCGLPDIYNGYPVAFNGTELTVTCHTGFYPFQIKMKCLNNNSWSEKQRCTPIYVFPLNISEIQLKNGRRPSEGRVEILVNGTWGTICDTNFASAEATVICKMFGLEYSSFYTKAKHRSGRGNGPIYVDKLNCMGTETHINLCSYEVSNHCTHYDDVAVVCTGYQLDITDIRLAGTNGPYHGRVELKVNGTWGTVCDDFSYLSFGAAWAICKIFGLT